MEAIEFVPVNFSSKGRASDVSTMFNIKNIIDLSQKNITLKCTERFINSAWSFVAVTNGDNTVELRTYSCDIPISGFGGTVVEDETRTVTHILIPMYAIIKADNGSEYPYIFEAILAAKIKVSNPKHIFDYKE